MTRRRKTISILVLMLLVLSGGWLYWTWPRIDPRLVGKWTLPYVPRTDIILSSDGRGSDEVGLRHLWWVRKGWWSEDELVITANVPITEWIRGWYHNTRSGFHPPRYYILEYQPDQIAVRLIESDDTVVTTILKRVQD